MFKAINQLTLLKENGLKYVDCNTGGYKRQKKGQSFIYLDKGHNRITNEKVLERINSLVIPPNWKKVWICLEAKGHIQATGLDDKGRKQYLYHPQWSQLQKSLNFHKLIAFGKALPLLKKKIKKDLNQEGFTLEKTSAIGLRIMDLTSIRVGNSLYTKTNGSYGLTTLKKKHVNLSTSNNIKFSYVGKKAVKQEKIIVNKQLYSLLTELKAIKGGNLLKYRTSAGDFRSLTPSDLNQYLKEISQKEITCKTFRTWNACFDFLLFLSQLEPPKTKKERNSNLQLAYDYVAVRLGNSKNISKKHYICPLLIEKYDQEVLDDFLKKTKRMNKNAKEEYLRKVMIKILNRIYT
ncbi:DNA topoisomerase IB [Sphingobacterium sp. PU5-4]|uniref:DNA topoisomerase n=1 Tax=Sphingobacterium tenebrionis TaxID=3111775 RepID=A0ABU8I469_9SPHI